MAENKKYRELSSFLGDIDFYISRQDEEGAMYCFTGMQNYDGVISYISLNELENFAKEILLFCEKESEKK